MREVTIAAIQMSCSRDVKENIEKAAKLIRAAAEAGAQIILPSELFERQYFCQERRYDYYDYAKPLSENDAVQSMKALAKELGVVIPVSFYDAVVERTGYALALETKGGDENVTRLENIAELKSGIVKSMETNRPERASTPNSLPSWTSDTRPMNIISTTTPKSRQAVDRFSGNMSRQMLPATIRMYLKARSI